MILVSGIIKQYGAKKVLDEVGADFPTGKLVVFIGNNGVGEGTLLSIITRTLEENEGEVLVEGRFLDRWRNRELTRHLSVLRQPSHLSVRIKVRELAFFGRFPYSHEDLTVGDEEKIGEAITYMGLGKLTGRYLDELSGGQHQMAYIAMVVAQGTKYILLGESLSNLDMKHSVQIMAILRRLVRERKETVMIVIHDISSVSHYTGCIVAMKGGEIVAGGDVGRMMNSHALEQVCEMGIEMKNISSRKVCLCYSA